MPTIRRPKRVANLRLRDVGNEVLAYHPQSGEAVLFNETGAALLHLCTGDLTTDEIIDEVAAATGASREQVLADVHAFLDSCTGQGLIADAEGPLPDDADADATADTSDDAPPATGGDAGTGAG